jgi:hypothetical protein
MSFSAIPFDADASGKDEDEVAAQEHAAGTETTHGGREYVHWQVVAETMGLLPAQIIAGRLQSEGIPARAWQESVGQAYGLTAGPLGAGFVSVPDSYADEALEILASDPSTDDSIDEQQSE